MRHAFFFVVLDGGQIALDRVTQQTSAEGSSYHLAISVCKTIWSSLAPLLLPPTTSESGNFLTIALN